MAGSDGTRSTGYGDDRGEGAFPQAQTRGNAPSPDLSRQAGRGDSRGEARERDALLAWLASERNDLEPAAVSIAPQIADVLGAIGALAGCRLARMSGSGSACFGLFDSGRAAAAGAKRLATAHPSWWVRAGLLGGDAALRSIRPIN
jgi:4-diphosphocytidyl-2C-methyl-D-erythritol kinase